MRAVITMKPDVYKSGCNWVAELDHGTWVEGTEFSEWDAALNHALWLGLCAGVWDA